MKIEFVFRILLAVVWFGNGLFAKVLGFVPRHEQIVARILGYEYASPITIAIGIAEIAMAIWIVSGLFKRVNVWLQILLVATMNCLELYYTEDLLLFGYGNMIIAACFIIALILFDLKYNARQAVQS